MKVGRCLSGRVSLTEVVDELQVNVGLLVDSVSGQWANLE